VTRALIFLFLVNFLVNVGCSKPTTDATGSAAPAANPACRAFGREYGKDFGYGVKRAREAISIARQTGATNLPTMQKPVEVIYNACKQYASVDDLACARACFQGAAEEYRLATGESVAP
jgi:hypothetical protein